MCMKYTCTTLHGCELRGVGRLLGLTSGATRVGQGGGGDGGGDGGRGEGDGGGGVGGGGLS